MTDRDISLYLLHVRRTAWSLCLCVKTALFSLQVYFLVVCSSLQELCCLYSENAEQKKKNHTNCLACCEPSVCRGLPFGNFSTCLWISTSTLKWMYVSSFLVATGVSCTGFRSTPFASAATGKGGEVFMYRGQRAWEYSWKEGVSNLKAAAVKVIKASPGQPAEGVHCGICTFDTDGHVRINALSGVL